MCKTLAEHYGLRICRIYELRNPAKVTAIPSLLEKYLGSEAELHERICEKYGVALDPCTLEPDRPRLATVQLSHPSATPKPGYA